VVSWWGRQTGVRPKAGRCPKRLRPPAPAPIARTKVSHSLVGKSVQFVLGSFRICNLRFVDERIARLYGDSLLGALGGRIEILPGGGQCNVFVYAETVSKRGRPEAWADVLIALTEELDDFVGRHDVGDAVRAQD